WRLKSGIPPVFPFETLSITVAWSGANASRSMPPLAFAAFKVWQVAQPEVANTAAPATGSPTTFPDAPPLAVLAPPPPLPAPPRPGRPPWGGVVVAPPPADGAPAITTSVPFAAECPVTGSRYSCLPIPSFATSLAVFPGWIVAVFGPEHLLALPPSGLEHTWK